MVDPKDVMFCIYYDENKRILGEGDIPKMRYYEIEAIRCVTSIRANGGKWSNCDIIVGMERPRPRASQTYSRNFRIMKDYLGVMYNTIPEYFGYTMEFCNPLNLQISNEIHYFAHYKRIVYLDLDIEVLKEFPDSFFDKSITLFSYGKNATIGQEDLETRFNSLEKIGVPCFNTYIVSNDPNSYFFRGLIEDYQARPKKYYDFFHDVECDGKNLGNFYLEESLYDNRYYTGAFSRDRTNVIPCDDVEGVYFNHRHLDEREIVKWSTLTLHMM